MDGSAFSDSPGVVVVADDASAAAAAACAIEGAGARQLAVVPWDGAAARLDDYAVRPLLLIETTGIDDERIAADLVALVAASPEHCLVSFAAPQLDLVAGTLLGGDAVLLCEPTPAERIAALVLVAAGRSAQVREDSDKAARLVRINEEVARFVETLGRLTGGGEPGSASAAPPIVGDPRGSFGQPQIETSGTVTAADLRRAIRARRLRDEIFGAPGLFEDPAWDMLLDLFAAELEHRRVSVSSLCIAAAVAPTTALRWISKLIDIGLLERRPDELDRRRAFVALTAAASAKMHDYLAAARRGGLGIA